MQFLDATQARVVLALKDSPGWSAELAEALGVSRHSLSNHLACLRVWPGAGLVIAAAAFRDGVLAWRGEAWCAPGPGRASTPMPAWRGRAGTAPNAIRWRRRAGRAVGGAG